MPTQPDDDEPINGVVIEAGVPSPKQDDALRKVYSMRQLLLICFSVGVVLALTTPNHSGPHVVGLWALGLPIGVVVLWLFWKVSLVFWHALDPFFETVPSPQVIAVRLEDEWGRPPTVVEVAAVQQMLINEHNQRLINGGIALGAIYLLGHHDQ
jgi:hypothetical protein